MKFRKQHSGNNQGIALFMVLGAVAVLSILVTEFVYVAQVNQKMAAESLDEVRSLYVAKSGLKLSLLRIKAYQRVKGAVKNLGAQGAVSPQILDMIWSFPFIFPIPAITPGLTSTQRESIEAFHESLNLDGSFSSRIEAESARYNLNILLASFAPVKNKSKKDDSKDQDDKADDAQNDEDSEDGTDSKKTDNKKEDNNKASEPQFDPEAARLSLFEYLDGVFQSKIETDRDFQDRYGNFDLKALVDNIIGWIDYTYESPNYPAASDIPIKRSPLYSITELHMVPFMEDELYRLFTPNLTASTTNGINVNKIDASVLKALFPDLTQEDVDEFFVYRDDPTDPHPFNDGEAFLKHIGEILGWTSDTLSEYSTNLEKRNLQFITEENTFRIQVQAAAGLASSYIEAVVRLEPQSNSKGSNQRNDQVPGQPGTSPTQGNTQTTSQKKGSGIKIESIKMI